MQTVKQRLPIAPADLHGFVAKIRCAVKDKIGAVNIAEHRQFDHSTIVEFETPTLTGHRFRDMDGNTIRKLNGFFLYIFHYLVANADSEHGLWYVVPFTTAEKRAHSGGNYGQLFLPIDYAANETLENMDFSPIVDYLASLSQQGK